MLRYTSDDRLFSQMALFVQHYHLAMTDLISILLLNTANFKHPNKRKRHIFSKIIHLYFGTPFAFFW